MRRLFLPLAALAGLLALSACDTVMTAVSPPGADVAIAALTCEEASAAFTAEASQLAALGVTAVLSGTFSEVVSASTAIVSGNVQGQATPALLATAATVLALRDRLKTCPDVPIESMTAT